MVVILRLPEFQFLSRGSRLSPSPFSTLLDLSRDGELIPPPQKWEGDCRINVSGSETQEVGARLGPGSGWDQGQSGNRVRLGTGSASDPAHHLGGPTVGGAWASH